MYASLRQVVFLFCTLILIFSRFVYAQEKKNTSFSMPQDTAMTNKKSTIKKFSFESKDWLALDHEDIKVNVTVNLLSPRLIGVSYLFEDDLEGIGYDQNISGFMYCVNRYLVVESGYLYASVGVEKILIEKNRVNFFLAVLNEGEVPTKAGTYAGIPWFDEVLAKEFKWEDFTFLNQVSEDVCVKLMKPDYSFRLIVGAV